MQTAEISMIFGMPYALWTLTESRDGKQAAHETSVAAVKV